MTMLTVSICVAALVSLAGAKIAADAARAKSALATAKAKRRSPRLPLALVAFAIAASIAALGAAFTYTSA